MFTLEPWRQALEAKRLTHEKVRPGVMEAHYGAVKPHPKAMEAHLGAMETHHSAVDAHSGPTELTLEL